MEDTFSPEHLPAVDVLIYNFIAVLAAKAYSLLGVSIDEKEEKKEEEIDFSSIRLAIDTMVLLKNFLENKIENKKFLEIQAMVANLQLAFVNRCKQDNE